MIFLISAIVFTWFIYSFGNIPATPPYAYELWYESIFIAMPFAELIPLTIALLFLSFLFWRLRKSDGWNTSVLFMPLFMILVAIFRAIAATLKIFTIIDPLKFPIVWDIAKYSRLAYAIIGLFVFAELLVYFVRIKPKIIIQSLTSK
jgi:hypothetical protein